MFNYIKCEYCDTPITKHMMKRHHQTKKCLLKQDILKKFKCVCNEKFISQEQLNEHISICLHVKLENIEKKHAKEINDIIKICDGKIDNYKKIVEEKGSMIEEKDSLIKELTHKIEILQTKLEGKEECLSISKTAKVTNNTNNTNNIKNMFVFNISERINPALLNYTKEHLLQGASGTAKWIKENIITDENGNKLYLCTDKSREVFKFMNEKREIITDVKAEFLLGSIKPKLIPIASDIRIKSVKHVINMYNPTEESDSETEDIELTKEQVKQEIRENNENDEKMFSEQKKIIVAYKNAVGSKVSKELVKII